MAYIQYRQRALLIGGGIGGLAAAIGLKKIGYGVEVYEQAPEPREVGAGLTLWSNAVRALKHPSALKMHNQPPIKMRLTFVMPLPFRPWVGFYNKFNKQLSAKVGSVGTKVSLLQHAAIKKFPYEVGIELPSSLAPNNL